MDYYCDLYDIFIKPKSKYQHFHSSSHKENDKSKHIKLTIENSDIKIVDKAFYEYIREHNRKNDYYHMKCEFKLFFKVKKACQSVSST